MRRATAKGAGWCGGRVRVPAAYHARRSTRWPRAAGSGWNTPSLWRHGPAAGDVRRHNPLFERASPAFMMAAGGTRSAALLLAEWAEPGLRDDWVPALIAGDRCATICISEPGAGSDVGRIRTRAVPDGERAGGSAGRRSGSASATMTCAPASAIACWRAPAMHRARAACRCSWSNAGPASAASASRKSWACMARRPARCTSTMPPPG